jgi:hypothetical protein
MMTIANRALVLNSDWRPINTLPVLDAVCKVFSGRALFMHPDSYRTYDFESWVTEWDEAVRTAQIAADRVMPMGGTSLVLPDVIVCTDYRGFGFTTNLKGPPKFSRKNLLLRDKCTCQFCGKVFPSEELTMDHVFPKSKGGQITWQNIVLSCVKCNHKKANRTPEQAHMKLIRQPFVPTAKDIRMTPVDRIRMKITNRPPKTWEQFLGKMYWSVALDNE